MIAYRIANWCCVLFQISILVLLISGLTRQDDVISAPREQGVYRMVQFQDVIITSHEAKIGYLTSPDYPNAYLTNISSSATLKAYQSNGLDAIRLSFQDLSLDTQNFCHGESIEFLLSDDPDEISRDNMSTIFTICGSLKPEPLVISSKSLLILFKSDAFIGGQNNRGFKIKFEFLNSTTEIYNGCEFPNQFKCRNRRCISNSLKCNNHDDCGDGSDEDLKTPCYNAPTIFYDINYTCGKIVNDQISIGQDLLMNRIVGGGRISQCPFQVSINFVRVEPISNICGGTLIHPLFVLTAAHCFRNSLAITDFKFVFGSNDLRSHSRYTQVRYAYAINIYPGVGAPHQDRYTGGVPFRDIDLTNDIALIELNAPVNLNSHVWPACLPNLIEPVLAGRVCFATGFGDTHGTGNRYELKKVDQEIQYSSECHSLRDEFQVDDYNMICVKNKLSNGPCNSDSGGPLLCSDEEEIYEDADETYEIPQGERPGDVIKYLPIDSRDSGNRDDDQVDYDDYSNNSDNTSKVKITRLRYTVHGLTSHTADGNIGGAFCGLDRVPTIYARVSTKVEWILSQLRMARSRLGNKDQQQDINDRKALFGYMFRNGYSRHENFTPQMTIRSTN